MKAIPLLAMAGCMFALIVILGCIYFSTTQPYKPTLEAIPNTIGLWVMPCPSNTYLKGDGTCTTPGPDPSSSSFEDSP